MLLNDIGRTPATTLKKINQHLESNYGFKITENVKDCDLVAIMETIQDEITDLKIKGDDAKVSPEISKRLLVLEGIKTVRENSMMQFQSPESTKVIKWLAEFVEKTYHCISLPENPQAAFDEALQDAMKIYRSSKYRFPDEYVEQKVRDAASQALGAAPAAPQVVGAIASEDDASMDDSLIAGNAGLEEVSNSTLKNYTAAAMRDTISGAKDRNPGMAKAFSRLAGNAKPITAPVTTNEDDKWGSEGKRQSAFSGRAPSELTKTQNATLGKLGFGSEEPSDEQVPMVRNPHTGKMQQDPFAVHAAARRKGIKMRENTNLVKHLRALLETEVSQAEVMMAAKGFAQELQEMVEKIGRLQNEDLPPVTDQMRETYGMSSASTFQTQIYGALQSVMDALYTAKGQVDDAVSNMATTGQVSATTDMDKDVGMDAGGMDDMSGMDAELDLDNIEGDLEADADEFGAASGEEPLGRSMKTEAMLQRKVMEMQKIVAKVKKLRESGK